MSSPCVVGVTQEVVFRQVPFCELCYMTMRSPCICYALSVAMSLCAPTASMGARACVGGFGAPCPVGWVDMGDKICSAPASYKGGCLSLVRMWDDEFRREFGA